MTHEDITRAESAMTSRLIGRLIRGELDFERFCASADSIRQWSNERREIAQLDTLPTGPAHYAALFSATEEALEVAERHMVTAALRLHNATALLAYGLIPQPAVPC